MKVRLHRFVDFLSGFCFDEGNYYYEIDDAVIENYKRALKNYEAVEMELIEQYADPKRKLNKVPCLVECEKEDVETLIEKIKNEKYEIISLAEKI